MNIGSLYYKNGLKFDTSLALNVDDAIARIDGKKASLIIVDGGVGEGKTTLGTEIGMYVGKKLSEKIEQEFSIAGQVRQGGKDFLKGMNWCVENNRRVVVYDEAGDFNSRSSLTYFNQNMNRVFETYRALKILVVLCLPHFSDIDTSLMKKKIARFLIHCYGRTNTQGNYKIYSLYRMWYLKAKMQKLTVPDSAYGIVSPNSYGHFLDLDPHDSAILEKHSIQGKKDIIKKGMLKDQGLITIQEVCRKTGYSEGAIRKYVSENNTKREKHGSAYFYKDVIIDDIMSRKAIRGSIISRKNKRN